MNPITPLSPRPIPKSYTSFESLLDEVRIFAPNVADPVALHVVRNSAIDFCRRSGIWYEEFDPILCENMVPFYDIPTPAGSVIVMLSEVWYAGVRINPQSNEELKRRYVNDWTNIEIYNGNPCWYTHTDLCQVRLVPCPKSNTNDEFWLTGIMILQPGRKSLGLPSDIAERWAEGIGYGARARLYNTPDQPYYNPGMAQKYERMFANEWAMAKIQANQARGRGPLHVNKRPFPAGGL